MIFESFVYKLLAFQLSKKDQQELQKHAIFLQIVRLCPNMFFFIYFASHIIKSYLLEHKQVNRFFRHSCWNAFQMVDADIKTPCNYRFSTLCL